MPTILMIVCIIVAGGSATATLEGPIQKVIELLTKLEEEVNQQAAAATKNQQDYAGWCKERSSDLRYEISTGKAKVEDLNAATAAAASTLGALSTKMEENAAQIAADEADLKAATESRAKEKADFTAEEAELLEMVNMLQHAMAILQRAKGGAAMVQLENARSIIHAFGVMVEASMMPAKDAAKLTSLIQNSRNDDKSWGAPDSSVYEGHGGAIIDTLGDILEKAQSQLVDARTRETSATHNFEMLKQSLEDSTKYAGQELAAAKTSHALQSGIESTAASDLAVTTKTLVEGEKTLETVMRDCVTKADNFDAETKSRNEEIKALAEAKNVISEMTSGAGALSYTGQPSFTQLSRSEHTTTVKSVDFQVVHFVRRIAKKQNSETLAQLSRRIASTISAGASSGNDPFAKVKSMIMGVLKKLEGNAKSEASHKAYCDSELGDALEKKEGKDVLLKKLGGQIDTMTARSANLEEEVADLVKALAALAKSQAEMIVLRQSQKKQYLNNKEQMEQGLQGIKMGLKLLREYYAGQDKVRRAATGSTNGIIGLLEVIESDFTKTFAKMTESEAYAQEDFDDESKDNEIEKTTKEQDVKYKKQEIAKLKKAIAEVTSDRQGAQIELSAILEYDGQLIKMCEEKPVTYEERKVKREAEIAGLKEALSILEGETALVQRGTTHQHRTLVHAHLAPNAP